MGLSVYLANESRADRLVIDGQVRVGDVIEIYKPRQGIVGLGNGCQVLM